jgi:hypothetical protein
LARVFSQQLQQEVQEQLRDEAARILGQEEIDTGTLESKSLEEWELGY